MADSYGKKLIDDLPQQFRGRERIEALLEVIGEQLDQVKAFYDSLNLERALETARGVQLDRIGSILVLTRAEAGLLIQDNEDYRIDDDTYRYILAYKIMLNNGSATYYDIVRGIKKFYKLDITYSETPSEPAAFMLEVGAADANLPLRNILPVKAAGVLCYYRFRLGGEKDAIEVSDMLEDFLSSGLECGIPLCGTYWMRATVGRTDNYEVDADRTLDGFRYTPDLTGTIPEIATKGQTESAAAINASVGSDEYTDSAKESGDVLTGVVPDTATLGDTESHGVTSGATMGSDVYASDLAGTVPDTATLGNTSRIQVGAGLSSDEDVYAPEAAATEVAGVVPGTATLGDTESHEIASGGSVGSDVYASDLAGTVPDTATLGDTSVIEAASGLSVDEEAYDPEPAATERAGAYPSEATFGETVEAEQTVSAEPETTVVLARQSGTVYCGQ